MELIDHTGTGRAAGNVLGLHRRLRRERREGHAVKSGRVVQISLRLVASAKLDAIGKTLLSRTS